MSPTATIRDAIVSQPIGFRLVGDGTDAYPDPRDAHSEHQYLYSCAVCRVGDFPEALEAVIAAVLDVVADRSHHCGSVVCHCFVDGYLDGMAEWQRKQRKHPAPVLAPREDQ